MKAFTVKDIVYLAVIVILIASTITFAVLWGRSRNEQKEPSYYETKCASFAVQNANLSHGQIVFIGDSITDGYHLDQYYNTLPLATYNRGIGGDTVNGVLRRLQVCLYDIAPSKIVLMIGINSINSGVPIETIRSEYRAILSSIKEHLPAADVTCLSVLPMDDRMAKAVNLERTTALVKELNASILSYTAEFGYRFVDLYPLFNDGTDHLIKAYSDDGLHPNAFGYEVWTNALLPYLQ